MHFSINFGCWQDSWSRLWIETTNSDHQRTQGMRLHGVMSGVKLQHWAVCAFLWEACVEFQSWRMDFASEDLPAQNRKELRNNELRVDSFLISFQESIFRKETLWKLMFRISGSSQWSCHKRFAFEMHAWTNFSFFKYQCPMLKNDVVFVVLQPARFAMERIQDNKVRR